MGVGGFDFTLQLTNFQGYTTFNERLSSGATVDTVDPEQTNAQLRPTFVLLYRLIDEDAIPGMPPTPLAGLNLVIPVRHDVASTGPNTFENTRVGAELWGKLIFRSLRGTTFLVTVGYDAQMFLHLDKVAHMGHLALRMGWGAL
jgi:hypothetical protein